jgi:hypothetical protein
VIDAQNTYRIAVSDKPDDAEVSIEHKLLSLHAYLMCINAGITIRPVSQS